MGKLKGYLQLIRPPNCFMMGFAVIVGASLVSSFNHSINLLLGFVTSFSLTAASMVINDYIDREIDSINEPNRPIPRGDIKPKEALSFAIILIALIISITYITKGKNTGLPGNFLVSATVVIPFIYGGLTTGQIETSTLLFVTIVFLSNTGREITKGIVDIEGDKKHNIKTIAVTKGEKIAAIMAATFSLIAVGISPLPWIWGIVTNWFIPLVIITDVGLIVSSIFLIKNPSRKNAKKIKNLTLIWFITGLIAFIIGRI